ncbi:MAG: chorismate mutase [Coriobacteriia bacterium]|nr:chorismate mutase [Coriobacteriia bacterium]
MPNNSHNSPDVPKQQLASLRQEIDHIDDQICELLLHRMQVVEQVAELKRNEDIPILHSNREAEILQRLTDGLTPQQAHDIETLYRLLFEVSRKRQS